MIRAAERSETDKAKSRGIQDMAVGRSDLFRLDPRELRVEPSWNSRTSDFNPDDVDDLALARSIAEVGVKTPMTVWMKEGVPILTDGHRRLAATLYALDTLGAEIKSVPVQTEPKHASEADRVLSQIVRNSGKPLAPIEKANVFAKLMDLGWSKPEIAKKVGVSSQYVSDMLELRAGPREVVALVASGQVSASLARSTMRSAGEDAGEVLGKAVATAKAAGKTKATPKHVEMKPRVEVVSVPRSHPTFQAGLRSALETARRLIAEGQTELAAFVVEMEREMAA